MNVKFINENNENFDALPLEYKLKEGCAFRYLNPADVMNKFVFLSEGDILGDSFKKNFINIS